MIYKNVNGTQKLVTNIRKPKKWRRFEYLQSSGTQYLEFPVSVKANESFGIELTFTLLSTSLNKVLITANIDGQFRTRTYSFTESSGSMLFDSTIGTQSTSGGWRATLGVKRTVKHLCHVH